MSSPNLSSLIAEAAFEKMLPSNSCLGIDESSEDGFLIVGIHLKVLVGKGAPDSLDQNENEVKLSAMDGQSLAQGAKELFAPEGPVCLWEMDAGWAFAVCSSFDSVCMCRQVGRWS